MHVVVVADSRYPIAQPFAGGMQAMTWHLVRGLCARGVEVTLFAGPGSDCVLDARKLDVSPVALSETARGDVSMPPAAWLEQHHAYLSLMLELSRLRDADVIHNNSLHHLPVAMSEVAAAPMITTLHSPPTPWLESAAQLATDRRHRFAAVSGHTARQWSHVGDVRVVPNGVDTGAWRVGPGGDALVWSGRIVPEKAPHLAVDIARRAGRRLRLAGPIGDRDYWRAEMVPRISGNDDVDYLGHLRQDRLAEVVGRAAACLVTPLWDEPYGLVAAEALSCGTPVVGFARGGLAEVVDPGWAGLVSGADVEAAAAAVDGAARLPRDEVRAWAERHCSLEMMVERYLALYTGLVLEAAA